MSKCKYCHKELADERSLVRHLQSKNYCYYPRHTFKTLNYLKPEEKVKLLQNYTDDDINKGYTYDSTYKCIFCSKVFIHQGAASKHQKHCNTKKDLVKDKLKEEVELKLIEVKHTSSNPIDYIKELLQQNITKIELVKKNDVWNIKY